MGVIIDNFLNELMYKKYIMSNIYVVIEYRKYLDEEKKIIKSFNHNYSCILCRDLNTEWERYSDYIVFTDPFYRKVFVFELLDKGKSWLNEGGVARILLTNINEICENLIPIYKTDSDVVLYFMVDTFDINLTDQLNGWREAVSNKYTIKMEQTHDIVLSDDLNEFDIETLRKLDECPDYRIIRSQNEDITLIRQR